MNSFVWSQLCGRNILKIASRQSSLAWKLRGLHTGYLKKILDEAEKILESRSFRNVYWLISDDISNLAEHIQEARGLQHPIAETATSIAYSDDITLGMVAMLLSKITEGHINKLCKNTFKIDEVLETHYSIAKVTEMFNITMRVHKCLCAKSTVRNYGNKIAILCGDYLLSRCFNELANSRDHDLLEYMGSALRDLTMGQYLGSRDENNRAYPFKPKAVQKDISLLETFSCEPVQIQDSLHNCKSEWFLRNTLGGSGLLGKACFSILKSAGYSQQFQNVAYSFGKYFNMAHQVLKEINDICFETNAIELTSLPVLLHLQNDEELFKYMEFCKENCEEVDYGYLRQKVLSGKALNEANNIKKQCGESALSIVRTLYPCEARSLLEDMIKYIEIEYSTQT